MNSLNQDTLGKSRIANWVVLILLCLASTTGRAQIDTGSLAGTVSDTSGGVIQNAEITATEQGSRSVYRTTTSSSGTYTFPSLRPGTYSVSASAPTFSVQQVTDLPIFVTTRASHNFTLSAGAATETVNVVANGPSLETETSDIGTVLTPDQVEDLPLTAGGAMRSLATLTFLAPGAIGPGTNGGTTYTKIGGGQTEGSDFLIDGISTQRSENGSGAVDQTVPSVDAIEEFRIETFALPAYIGRTTGGLANFKTKAGTNTYHGTVYDFFTNTILDANNWFNKGNAILNGGTQDSLPNFRRATDQHQDYGATLGGALNIPHIYNGRDKTFFFFSFENVPSTFGHTNFSTVPTLAQRMGDFSSTLGSAIPGANNMPLLNPCTGQPILAGQIFDPNSTKPVMVGNATVQCRTPFMNNQVPLGRSQVAAKVLALIPLPNYTGPGTTNYTFNGNEKVSNTDYSLRLDQNVGTRNHLFAFGNMRENFDSGNANLPSPINSGSQLQDFYAKQIRLGWDVTITPHLVNQLTLGGNRINSFNSAPPSLLGVNYDAQLGIPNTPGAGTTFPTFGIGEGLPGLGSSNFDDNVDNALEVDDDINLQKGPHSIRVGGTYRWQQFSYINNGPAAGYFNFSRAQTAGSDNTTAEAQSGNSIASFLLGVPASDGRTLQIHFPRWIQTYIAGYAQDDWKARKNLTLNLGFRYSVDTPRHEAAGDIVSFDPTIPNPGANGRLGALRFGGVGTGRDGNKNETFAQTYYGDYEPRVGFAYSPGWLNDKAVLRGSYTIMYGPLIYSDYGQGLSAGFTQNTGPNANAGNGFLSAGPLDAGPPTLPLTATVDASLRNGQGPDYVAPGDGRPAKVQNWSLETQTTLAPDLIFTLGYLGEHSTRLRSLVYYPNTITPAYFGLGDLLGQPATSPAAVAAGITLPFANITNIYGPGVQVGQTLRPFPQYGYINNDSYLQNRGQSTYHAMEAKMERKFRNGLNLLASYTWSKTLTDADAIQPFFATTLGQGGTQNPFNLKGEKAASTQDVPTNFVISYLYELPVGKGKKFLGHSPKVVDALIGGFRIGGIDRYVSGQPISFFGASGVPYFDGSIRFSRAVGTDIETTAAASGKYNPFNFVRNTNPNNVNPTSFFNRAAFVDVNDAAHRGSGPFHFGNLPRNTTEVRTPAYFNEDMNISKHFPIHEQLAADLRFEGFNVFNRHVFGKPDSGVNDQNFGQIGGLNDGPRHFQLVLKVRY